MLIRLMVDTLCRKLGVMVVQNSGIIKTVMIILDIAKDKYMNKAIILQELLLLLFIWDLRTH